MKQIKSLIFFLALFPLLTSLAYAKVEIKLAHSAPASGDKTDVACQAFKKMVEEKTNNEITINIFPNNQLGNERELLEGVQFGTIEMIAITTGAIPTIYKDIMVFDIPYLFSSSPVAWKVLDGEFGVSLREDFFKKTGVKFLAFGENGYRNFTNSVRPVKSPSDLVKLKIRTMENPAHIAMIRSMKAIPTPIPYSELYTALSQKVVDGQENPVGLIVASKFYEVQKYVTLDGHIYSPHTLMMGGSFFSSLSKAHQNIILDASKLWTRTHREYQQKQRNEGVQIIKKGGSEVYEITPEELKEFREATSKVLPIIEKDVGKDLVAKALSAVKKAEEALK